MKSPGCVSRKGVYWFGIMKLLIAPLAALSLFVTSCAQSSLTGDTYSRAEAGRAQSVEMGTIQSIRKVALEGESTSGTVLGGLAGAVLGSQIGSGRGRTVAGAAGAALGGIAGSHAGQAINTRPGLEMTIRLDSGETISVVQEANKREPFYEGERVRVLSNGRTTRVTH